MGKAAVFLESRLILCAQLESIEQRCITSESSVMVKYMRAQSSDGGMT